MHVIICIYINSGWSGDRIAPMERPAKVGGLSVQLDSNDTKSSAEAFFQDFLFQAAH